MLSLTAFALGTLALSAPADAAFGGKVKNIRIRERNNTNGYRVVVIVKDDADNSIDASEATVTFEPVDGGPELEGVDLTTLRRQRLDFTVEDVDLSGLSDDGTLSLSLDTVINGTVNADPGEITVTSGSDAASAPWSTTGVGETGKYSARLIVDEGGETGTLDVRIADEDRDWDGSSVGSLTVSYPTAEETLEVTAEEAGTRYALQANVSSDSWDAVSGYSYTVSTTLLDAEGTELTSQSNTMELGGTDYDDGIYKSVIKERRKGGYKVVSYSGSDDGGRLAALSTEVSDVEGTLLMQTYDEAPVGIERDFVTPDFQFDGDVSGMTFNVTIALYDADGRVIGDPITADLTHGTEVDAQEHEALVVNLPVFAQEGGDGTDAGLIVNDVINAEGDVGYGLSVLGDDDGQVAGIEMQFNEPFEGPSPQENPVQADFVIEWHKWVDTFEVEDGTDLGDTDLIVDQVLFDDEGAMLDEWGWSGPPASTMQNGKGKKKTAHQTQTRPNML